ncbi:MAG TPA: hypothetical protein VF064_17105 [Pyrinomonadaceae bacterium]
MKTGTISGAADGARNQEAADTASLLRREEHVARSEAVGGLQRLFQTLFRKSEKAIR